jgi:hypothetical protein
MFSRGRETALLSEDFMKVLQSQLFKGDDALNACLNDDSAHIFFNRAKPNVGPHIGKIQDALFLLLHEAVIDQKEITDTRFGESTEAAVFAYKTKFQIINRNYQQSVDKIVGKMTIDKLDKDMAIKEADFPRMISFARAAAFQRCFVAHQRVVGIGPTPDDPKRVDPNLPARLRALESAQNIFDQADLDLSDLDNDSTLGITLGKMKNILANGSLPTVNVPSSDPRSHFREAFVENQRAPVFLCPQFFATTDEQRIRTFVHEAAHMAGIGDPQGEAYYSQYNCQNTPPDTIIGQQRTIRRVDQADTWSKFVHCVSGQPPDTAIPDVINRGP